MDLTRAAIDKSRVTAVALLVVVAGGLWSWHGMSRAEDPPMIYRRAVVLTWLPGASPTRVERLINDKVEAAVQQLPELDYVASRSKTGVSLVIVGVSSQDVAISLQTALSGLETTQYRESDSVVPVMLRYEFGGEEEGSIEANRSIVEKLPVGAVIILLLLVAQFNSLRRTAIILLTIPLGFIGVVVGLIVAQSHFGFMALLGHVALAGIVINNAIVLIDRIGLEMQSGLEPLMRNYEARFRWGVDDVQSLVADNSYTVASAEFMSDLRPEELRRLPFTSRLLLTVLRRLRWFRESSRLVYLSS